ncbi:hypothetical protein LTR91_015692 [Friedmanniomyces endolithicus]|uniref:Uncharacterized protein n=1 Tax=Friedmanniomyces endolithicus TaxID=329885 RepID=A0AAN6K9B4_9PEZI|nr:hypothetical protein LTR35_012997 [Friedmanniomyces endolithicus]KAK0283096.1 hypothetical protein LTS00_011921 [Friedmanniomyces endolithicus]KAK0326046.1 hypothetical protein LTR82_002791 [Friedmanniomyces endolithicus]KAK0903334.1 hypothetical protein LTR57_019204 [Friedmanniomyces endolithicus]KAK0967298.1 hypothetical protein LTS01_017341 [Friedmanniomyces endolithicus]
MLNLNFKMCFTAIFAMAFASAAQTTTSTIYKSQVGHVRAPLCDERYMSITLHRVVETAAVETALSETSTLNSAITSAKATVQIATKQIVESTLVSVSRSPHSNHTRTTLCTSTTRRDPNRSSTTFRTSWTSKRAATTPFATLHITTSRRPATTSALITSTWDPNGPQPTYDVPSIRPGYFRTNAEGFRILKAQHTVPYECADQWKLDHPGRCFGGTNAGIDCMPTQCAQYA